MKVWKVLAFILKSTFMAFGGGNALFPFMRIQAVDKNKWMTNEEFDKLIITTNMIPGPSVVESISYISIKVLGKWKGILITLIGLLPHIFLALGIFILAQNYLPKKYLWVINVSIMPVIIGILFSFTWRFVKISNKEVGYPLMITLSIITASFSIFIPNPWNIPAIIMILVIFIVLFVEIIKDKKKKAK